jgi:hypothetical protein
MRRPLKAGLWKERIPTDVKNGLHALFDTHHSMHISLTRTHARGKNRAWEEGVQAGDSPQPNIHGGV